MPLKEEIWDARSQWKDIGRKLGLKDGDIHAINPFPALIKTK